MLPLGIADAGDLFIFASQHLERSDDLNTSHLVAGLSLLNLAQRRRITGAYAVCRIDGAFDQVREFIVLLRL